MKRGKFTYLCLGLSIIGLAIMQFSVSYLKPEPVPVAEVDSSKAGETVKINGTVKNFYSTPQASFFTVKDSSGEIQVVDFDASNLDNGRRVSVLGRVELREGDLQLVSTEIEQN